MKNVVALILAGGRSTEYGVLTQNRVKGALNFASNFRIIDFALSNLRNSGIDKVGLIIQYLPSSLIEHVGEGRAWDLHGYGRALKLMPPFVGTGSTSWYRGTAEAVSRNMSFVDDLKPDTVMVLSGEHVFHEDFNKALSFHHDNNADITMIVKDLPEEEKSSRFGYAVLKEGSNRVEKFIEKPQIPPANGFVSNGTYIFKRKVLLELLEETQDSAEKNLTRDVLQPYCGQLQTYAYKSTDFWNYLGNPIAYQDCQLKLTRGEGLQLLKSWGILTNAEDRNSGYRAPAFFTKSAQIDDTIVGPGCRIEGTVAHSILSPGVKISKGAVVRNSVLMHDCTVEAGAHLDGVISDKDVCFGTNSRVGYSMPQEGISKEHYEQCKELVLVAKGLYIMPNCNVPKGIQLDK